MAWSIPLELHHGTQPLFLRITAAIIADIRRGRLVAGERLPSSRALASELGVHRNTVLAALHELRSQGWIETQPGRAVFVASALPDPPRRPGRTRRNEVGFALPLLQRIFDRHDPRTPPRSAGDLIMDSATPDPRLFPVDVLARAWRRTLTRHGRKLLTYDDDSVGHRSLRRALATMLRSTRGMTCTEEDILITRGSQMAIDLVARTVLAPGDRVVVEALGYRPAWDALRWAGAELIAVPVDGHGLDIAHLEELARDRPIRAVYLTPHHHFPTTVVLSAARRMQLLTLAQRHRWMLLEDDYDSEFHYEGRPVAPLAAADPQRNVVYVGTLSKILAPGLRLGFLTAPADVIARMARARAVMDRQGDHTMEAAVAEIIDQGELQRHVRRMRGEYLVRRDTLATALRSALGTALRFESPRGGMALWAEVDPEFDATAWAHACCRAGLRLAAPAQYAFAAPAPNALRFAFSPLRRNELLQAVAIAARSLTLARRSRLLRSRRS